MPNLTDKNNKTNFFEAITLNDIALPEAIGAGGSRASGTSCVGKALWLSLLALLYGSLFLSSLLDLFSESPAL